MVFVSGFLGVVHVHGAEAFGLFMVEAKETGASLRESRHKGTPLPLFCRLCQRDGWLDVGGLFQANGASNLS